MVARTILFRLATSPRLERAVRSAPLGEHLVWRAAAGYLAGTAAEAAIQAARQRGAEVGDVYAGTTRTLKVVPLTSASARFKLLRG